MSRYIDAEKLKCSIDSETDSIFDWDMTIEELYYNLCKLVDDEPTADVQEVKRGYWKFNQHSKVVASFRCSECQTRFYNFGNSKILSPTPYCPNCGARMDGDSSIADIINEQPIADVQEVKHGEWLKPSNDSVDSKQWICSECKGLTETAYYCGHCYYNYCPNCGARMDGVANG